MAGTGKPPTLRLGEMAVAKGYCTSEQLDEALRIQADLADRGRDPRPLLGILMVRHGILSTGQLIEMLKAMREAGGE